MQITEKLNDGLKREYEVFITAKSLAGEVDEKLQSVASKVKMQGFRPGKAPMSIIKKRYGDGALNEVIEDKIKNSIEKIIKDNGLNPALQPSIDGEKFEEGRDLQFTVKIENLPEIKELDISAIEFEKSVISVSDKEIDNAIEALAKKNATKTPKSKTAKVKKGDFVDIDFLGKVDGVAFAGGEAKNYELEIGSGSFIEGFEDQIIGAKTGDEILVEVKFPEAYEPSLAGKDATFEVVVNAILKEELPEITEEFAKENDVKSIADLRSVKREELSKIYANYTREYNKKNLFDELEKICKFDVPEGMVKMEFDAIWEGVEKAKDAGEDLEKSEDELRIEYQAIANRRVLLGLFLADISKKNSLEVNNEEIQQALYMQAMQTRTPFEEVIEYCRKNPNYLNYIKGPILEEKAVDFILNAAKLTEKSFTFDEWQKFEEAEKAKEEAKDKSKNKSKKVEDSAAKKKTVKKDDEAA